MKEKAVCYISVSSICQNAADKFVNHSFGRACVVGELGFSSSLASRQHKHNDKRENFVLCRNGLDYLIRIYPRPLITDRHN